MHDRKVDHIELASQAKIAQKLQDKRFYYEPLAVSPQPSFSFEIGGKSVAWPLWVSSMTGGIRAAGLINRTLAKTASKFGLGMGLGSLRMALEDSSTICEFEVRSILGSETPLFGNLGLAQVDQLLKDSKIERLESLYEQLQLDGICLHINPLQEWCQPEGDSLERTPLEIIEGLLKEFKHPIIVKEVGQGIGPESLKALMNLPLEAIEFGAFGGTNFTRLELLRSKNNFFDPVAYVGQNAYEMVEDINALLKSDDVKCKKFIVSGGIDNFLDGYYLIQKLDTPAIYGQAGKLLEFARQGQASLDQYVEAQIEGLKVARRYLRIRKSM